MKRRQEPRGYVGGVLVIDDFAHHPDRRPRDRSPVYGNAIPIGASGPYSSRGRTPAAGTSTRRSTPTAFDDADVVTIQLPEPHDKVPADQQLDVPAIVRELRKRGIEASVLENVPAIVELIVREARANDVILMMSNGAFGGLIPLVLTALETRTEH